jgi:hypothetical protein
MRAGLVWRLRAKSKPYQRPGLLKIRVHPDSLLLIGDSRSG